MSARPERFERHHHAEMGGDIDYPGQDLDFYDYDQAAQLHNPFSDVFEMHGDDAELGRGILDSLKSVVKSPLVKVAAGGLAMVFPPVGIPLTAGLVAADQVIAAVESKNPGRQAAAKKFVERTAVVAKTNPDAGRALKLLAHAKKARKARAPLDATQRSNRFAAAFKRQSQAKQVMSMAKANAQKVVKLEALANKLQKAGGGRALQGSAVKGFLVTTLGRVIPGSYLQAAAVK